MCTCWCPITEPSFALPAARRDDAHKSQIRRFRDFELTILWTQFEKSSYISREEAEHLAEVLNVDSKRICRWFQNQRSNGGLKEKERTLEGRHYLTKINVS